MAHQRTWQWHLTAADWLATGPVLFAGEIGYETDTNRQKFGDGVSAWAALPYCGGSGGGSGTFDIDDGDATGGGSWEFEEGGA